MSYSDIEYYSLENFSRRRFAPPGPCQIPFCFCHIRILNIISPAALRAAEKHATVIFFSAALRAALYSTSQTRRTTGISVPQCASTPLWFCPLAGKESGAGRRKVAFPSPTVRCAPCGGHHPLRPALPAQRRACLRCQFTRGLPQLRLVPWSLGCLP